MANWKKVRLPGNDKPVDAYQRDNLTICLNINKGQEVDSGVEDRHGNHWWYEVTETNGKGEERFVGEAPTLPGAKRVATRSVNA